MKTFPVKIAYREDENHRQNELIRAEIKFAAEIKVNRKYLPQIEKSTKNKLTEHLQRQLYGDIETALVYAERDFRTMRPADLPMSVEAIFRHIRNSIPKLTYENNP